MVIAQPGEPGILLPPLVGLNLEKQITDLLYDRLAEIGDDLNTVGDKGFKPQLADAGSGRPTRCRSCSISTRAHAGTTAGRCARTTCATAFALMKTRRSARPRCRSSRTSIRSRCATRSPLWRTSSGALPSSSTSSSTRSSILPEHVLEQHARRAAEDGRGRASRHRLRPLPARRAGSRASAWSSSPTPPTIAVGRSSTASSYADPRLQHGGHPLLRRRRRLLRAAPARAHRADRDGHRATRAFPIPTLSYAYLAFNLVDAEAAGPAASDLRRPRRAARAHDGGRPPRDAAQRVRPLRHAARTAPSRARSASPTRRCRSSPTTRRRRAALLDSAGWLPGPDGVRVKDGRRSRSGSRARIERGAEAVRGPAAGRVHAASARRSRIDDVDFASFMAKHGDRSFDAIIELFGTDPSPRARSRAGAPVASARTERTTRRTATPRWTRCSTARRRRSIPRARAPTRAAPSRRSSRTRRASGCTSRRRSRGVHKRIRTTTMRAGRLLGGNRRLVDPGRRAHRARPHRAPAGASSAVRRYRRRPAAAGGDRRASSSRRSPSCSSTSRPATRSRSRSTVAGVTEEVRAAVARGVRPRPAARRAVRALGRQRAARRPRVLGLLPAAGRRRDRRRAAAHAAARRARAGAAASRSGSSSACCQARAAGRCARPLARPRARSLLYSRARLLARAGRAARLRVLAPAPAAGGIVDPVMHDYMTPGSASLDRLQHLVLPVGTLTLLTTAAIARYQRSALLEVMPSDWMRTARAKGLSRAPRRAAPRAAQRAPADDHARRPVAARARRRRGVRREGVLLAGHGAPRRERDRRRATTRSSPRPCSSTSVAVAVGALARRPGGRRSPTRASVSPDVTASDAFDRRHRRPPVLRRLFRDSRARIALVRPRCSWRSAPCSRPLLAPYDPTAQLDIVGSRASRRRSRTRSAPTSSAATCCRGSSTARASRSPSALGAVRAGDVVRHAVGVVAGYVGGAVDAVLMRLVDAALSIPRVLLLIVVAALWGDARTSSRSRCSWRGTGWFARQPARARRDARPPRPGLRRRRARARRRPRRGCWSVTCSRTCSRPRSSPRRSASAT